jgi:hypothetical protein
MKIGGTINRRECLRGLAALAASGWVPQGFAQAGAALTPAQFTALSNVCTGYAFSDARTANAMLRALVANVGGAKLSRLAALASSTPPSQLDAALAAAGLTQSAETVVTALYTGVVDGPKGPVVVSYDQALVWQACGWTKPNASCGGMTNYWANAPQGMPT